MKPIYRPERDPKIIDIVRKHPIDFKKQGKKNRAKGAYFERKVRAWLEKHGWIVDRWTNNVEFNWFCGMENIGKDPPFDDGYHDASDFSYQGKLVPAKTNRFSMRNTGFPDFIAYKEIIGSPEGEDKKLLCADGFNDTCYEGFVIVGLECKSNGKLDKDEKEKSEWCRKSNIFTRFLIAKKGKKRGEIIFDEFKI